MICAEIALRIWGQALYVWVSWTHACGLTPPPEEVLNA